MPSLRRVLTCGLAASAYAASVPVADQQAVTDAAIAPPAADDSLVPPEQKSFNFSSSLGFTLPPVDVKLHGVGNGKSILYAVSTCAAYHATRAKSVYETWCHGIESCIFYSDHEAESAPLTVKIHIEKHKVMDGLQEAQMRYMRILGHAAEIILANAHGVFAKNKWLVIADDDSYVFHHNMLSYLNGDLDFTKPHYTGHTLVDKAYPVNDDGEGHTLTTSIRTHFACGGGGSVFSHGALKKMKHIIPQCIEDSLPGHFMWRWQSDWMMGECAHKANVKLVDQPADRFGQFLFRPSDMAHLLVDDPEKIKHFCELNHGRCKKPLSIHPVKEPKGAHAIFKHAPESAHKEVTNIKPLLHLDGSVTFG